MELSRCGEELGGSGLPKLDGGFDKRSDHLEDLGAVLLLREKSLENLTIDTLDGLG